MADAWGLTRGFDDAWQPLPVLQQFQLLLDRTLAQLLINYSMLLDNIICRLLIGLVCFFQHVLAARLRLQRQR